MEGRGPASPDARIDRVGRAAQREQIEQGRLIVAVPLAGDKALLGVPAHRYERPLAEHPRPVDAIVDGGGEAANFGFGQIVAIIILAGEQDAAEQQHSVDRRQFSGLEPVAAVQVDEMVEKAAVAGDAAWPRTLGRGGEEAQCGQCAVARLGAGDPATLHADRIGVEREADRGDRAEAFRGPAIGHQSIGRISGVPEPLEGAALEIVNAEPGGRGGMTAGWRAAADRGERQRRAEAAQFPSGQHHIDSNRPPPKKTRAAPWRRGQEGGVRSDRRRRTGSCAADPPDCSAGRSPKDRRSS